MKSKKIEKEIESESVKEWLERSDLVVNWNGNKREKKENVVRIWNRKTYWIWDKLNLHRKKMKRVVKVEKGEWVCRVE